MLIDSVHLENIKSYERADVTFAEGTNAICGPNGAGKSTIIEAVGFALFGSQRVRLEQLIRGDSGHGRIEVSFRSSLDELSYRVVRDLRRSGASTVTLTSDDLGAVVATGVREVQDQLVQHLGLRPGVKLPSLFEGVIGVPQGQLTYDFLLPPAPRKARFEELLALQEFELAYQRLAGPMQHGRTEAAKLAATLAAMSEQLAALPGVEARLVELRGQGDSLKVALTIAQQALGQAQTLHHSFDEQQAELQAAREEAAAAQARSDLSAQRLAEAARRRDEAVAAVSRTEEARPDHDRYVALDGKVHALEVQTKERDAITTEGHKLERDAGRIEEALRLLTARLDEATTAQHRLAELQPALDRQAQLEQARDRAQEAVRSGRAAKEHVDRLATLREANGRTERELSTALPQLEHALARRKQLVAARDKANERLTDRRGEYAHLHAQIEAQRAALAAVERGDSAACPACGRPFEGGDVESFVRHLGEQTQRNSAEAARVERRGKRLRKAIDRVDRMLHATEERIGQLRQNQAKLAAVQQTIAGIAEQAAGAQQAAAKLPESEAALADVEAQLRALGDPRTRSAALGAQAAALAGTQWEVAQHRERLDAMAARRQALAEQLAHFAGADEALAEARTQRDACHKAYDTFRRFAPLAEELPDREQEWRRCEGLHSRSEEAALAAAARHGELAAAYDGNAHQAARDEERRHDVEAAAIRSQLRGLERQLEEGGQRLAELHGLEERAEQARGRLASTEAALSALRVVRDAVRLAGPEIARRLLRRVSSAANRMFSEMMNDYAIELVWRDDYGITLRRGSETRDFAQLSGGEQMTAALGVRLALLREVSDVGIAFFDEPTVNLDQERRENLAEQLRNIQGFSQLFVISHDDSLEGVTDHIVRVSKEHAVSRIEQA